MEQSDSSAMEGTSRGRETSPPPPAPPEAVAFLGPQLDPMEQYVAYLCDTGVSHGLVGPREVPRMWERHILNCAAVHPGLPNAASVADVGAGAGLPGLVLAIARPDLNVTLIEPLFRRTIWLEDVVRSLGLRNVEVSRGRAEEFWGQCEFDVVTSRAVARIGELARWCLPLVKEGGDMFALKGSRAGEEVDEDADTLRRLHVSDVHIQEWGHDVVEPATVTVRLRTASKAPELTRKQAGVVNPKSSRPRR